MYPVVFPPNNLNYGTVSSGKSFSVFTDLRKDYREVSPKPTSVYTNKKVSLKDSWVEFKSATRRGRVAGEHESLWREEEEDPPVTGTSGSTRGLGSFEGFRPPDPPSRTLGVTGGEVRSHTPRKEY